MGRFHRPAFFSLLFLLLSPAFASGQAPPRSQPQNNKGPLVGEIAPELELNSWIQKPEGAPVKLSELRGKVVLIQTFAWNCVTCLRAGIPAAVSLREANADRGLSVISITTPTYREETLKVMREKNITHPVAAENPMASASPYVKIPINPITYYFVIGRNGDVVWRGSPSGDLKGCLDAVQRALNQEPGRTLERRLHAALAKAVEAYCAESYEEARRLAEKLSHAQAKSKASDAAAISADASYLVERIQLVAGKLAQELEIGYSQKDALRYVAARDGLRAGFGKGMSWEAARPIIEKAEKDKEFAAIVKVAAQWRELARQRPPLFPSAEPDAASKAYALALQKFIREHPGSEPAKLAEDVLKRWGQPPAPKPGV